MLPFHLSDFLKSNQFASGGLVMLVLGGIAAYFRQVPEWIWDKIVDQTTMSLTVTDDEDAFKWIHRWFAQRENTKKVRRVDIRVGTNGDVMVVPAPGHHWSWYNGRPLSISFVRVEEKKEKYGRRSEHLTIRTLGRKQKFLREFLLEVEKAYREVYSTKPSLYVWSEGMWTEKTPYEPRPLNSVILSGNHKNLLLKDIGTFRESNPWYTSMGIPYHRGYLFYGLPGTGKTSLVTGLSNHFNAKVYALKLSELNDRSLMEAINGVEAHSMVVIEDIDCVSVAGARKSLENEKDTPDVIKLLGVTLSGLLNVIDGLLTPHGIMFFMTTNHIEKLDPALIRPGRIDLKLEFALADDSQKQELFSRFFPDETISKQLLDTPMTMADFQGKLMRIRNERQVGATEEEPSVDSRVWLTYPRATESKDENGTTKLKVPRPTKWYKSSSGVPYKASVPDPK